MKRILNLGFVFLFLSTLCLKAQTNENLSDTLKKSKLYKNNIKTQPLLVLPLTYIELTYERALTKKISLSLSCLYTDNHFNTTEYFLSPSFTYYFSKFRKEKFNRGFFAKAMLPYYSGTKESVARLDYQGIYIAVGGGYQWIIGKRFVAHISAAIGPPLWYQRKSIDVYGDGNWHNYNPNAILVSQQLGIGFTF